MSDQDEIVTNSLVLSSGDVNQQENLELETSLPMLVDRGEKVLEALKCKHVADSLNYKFQVFNYYINTLKAEVTYTKILVSISFEVT